MSIRKSKRSSTYLGVLVALVLLCALVLTACASPAAIESPERTAEPPAEAETTVTDMAGRSIKIPSSIDRIVGIGSSSLRIIAYLQATDLVVGVEQSEHEPNVTRAYNWAYQDEFKALPIIGEGGSKGVTPNEEAILGVAPQLIVANIDKDSADALQERTGIPVVVIASSTAVFDQVFFDNVSLVGNVLKNSDRADEIIAFMKESENDLQRRTANLSEDKIKTAYAAGISFRGGHGFAGTEANFSPFTATQVKNVADGAGAEGAFDIDLEKISSAQPDLIFIEAGNIPLISEDYESNPDYFASLDAVNAEEVYSLIGYRFYATNIELAIANCYQVGASAYPEQFSDIDPAQKLDEVTEFFLGSKLYADLEAAGYGFTKLDIAQL